MNAIRVLLWKEWREQRLTLLLVALVVVCAAVGAWRMKHSDLTMWTGFCAAAIGLVLGAAAAEAQVPTLAFLRANPVPLHVVWWVKCAFGIVSVGVMSLATAALFWLVGRGIKLISPDWVWLEMPIVSLFCYVLAQYFGGWAKSPITAIGLSLLLGVSLMVLAGVNPMGLYLPPVVGPFLALGLFVGLLWLGGTAFMRAGRSERGFSKRQALAWSSFP